MNQMDVHSRCTHDFSTLRKPGQFHHNRQPVNGRVQQIHNISAGQLFQDQTKHVINKQLNRRSTSTPSLSLHETTQSSTTDKRIFRSYTPCPRRKYMPHEAYFDPSYWNKTRSREEVSHGSTWDHPDSRMRAASFGADDSCYESIVRNNSKPNRSDFYEDMYKKVRSKLKKHIRREEVFSQEEIQKACYEIRKQANDIVLNDGWLDDMLPSDQLSLDSEVLKAAYLLRNSHRKDLFNFVENQTQSSASNSSGIPSINEYRKVLPVTSINDEELEASRHGSITHPSHLSFSSGEETSTNISSPSSGRSTPSFRRRPKRPDIKLTDLNKPYKDYIEILRAESLSSLQSDKEDGSNASNRNSFLEISEEMIAKAFLSQQFQDEINDDVHEFERTIEAPQDHEDFWKEIEKVCDERPSSPTAELLFPLLLNKTGGAKVLHQKLSPLLHKLKSLEEKVVELSSLKVSVAVLQEEKRQLSTLLHSKRNNEMKEIQDVGVQKSLEIITEIAHKQTSTDNSKQISVAIGDEDVAEIFLKDAKTQCEISSQSVSCQQQPIQTSEINTQTVQPIKSDVGIGGNVPADLSFASKGTQHIIQTSTLKTQTECITVSVGLMAGTVTKHLVEVGVGEDICERVYSSQNTQTNKIESSDKLVQAKPTDNHKYTETEPKKYVDEGIQANTETSEFCCGENIAELIIAHKFTSCSPKRNHAAVNTEQTLLQHQAVQCFLNKPSRNVGVGEGNVFNVFCDCCSNVSLVDKCCGEYVESELPCCTDDKLCQCVKPQTLSISVGNHTIHDTFCDRCDNLVTSTIGISNHSIMDLLCDKCEHLQTMDIGVGEGNVMDVVCDVCENKPQLINKSTSVDACKTNTVGIGDGDVHDVKCTVCEKGEENVFNFDLSFTSPQLPILCHYCGNKVDLNDSSLDESLQAMRDSMQSISSGMKRTEARKDLNLELEDYATQHQSKGNTNVTPVSDDATPVSEDEEEEVASHDDVIQACKMLHNHFSGEKPLKQHQMMKYVAVIQSLWFKTVKKRRANASVVKSYIDLFQQRIPELLETIINLADEDANTALHYALTYKNVGVVSILLDSGECCVDLVNQAGYTPVMLASLTGYERKNDKYIMQRLLRLGNINKESSDTGQTPLMLAVSRGNIGMVELLLDVCCDINSVDDEGSTALMCACEHGNINMVKMLLANPDCDATIEDNEGSTALSIAMDSRRKDLALLIYGSLNFDARGRIKLSPSKQSLLGLGRRSPSPVIGRR